MNNEELCIFCGQKPGTFRGTTVAVGGYYQIACKSCAREVEDLDEISLCRRALQRGLASHPEKIEERIQVVTEAEDHRPKCLRCGGRMIFQETQTLDNSPLRDSILSTTFDIRPAYCEDCGLYEFYNPEVVRKHKYLAYLIRKDTK